MRWWGSRGPVLLLPRGGIVLLSPPVEVRLGHGACFEMWVGRTWLTSGQKLRKPVGNSPAPSFCHSFHRSTCPWRHRAPISQSLRNNSKELLPAAWLVLDRRCEWVMNFYCVKPLDFGGVCYCSMPWPVLNGTPQKWTNTLFSDMLAVTMNAIRH